MSSEKDFEFTKENIDIYLKAVAKEYRKLGGKAMPADVILIGGASILINYGFRGATTDVDALIYANSAMKDAINHVGDKYELPNGWLNADFMKTSSYSPRLWEHAVHYRTYSNVLTIRTISAEYLIAMKLESGRRYKKDMSDILGILQEHAAQNSPITLAQIKKAYGDLYGAWTSLSERLRVFIEDAMADGDYARQYQEIAAEEEQAHTTLLHFQEEYPGVTTTDNVNDVLSVLLQKQKPSIREQLEQAAQERKIAPEKKEPSRKEQPER